MWSVVLRSQMTGKPVIGGPVFPSMPGGSGKEPVWRRYSKTIPLKEDIAALIYAAELVAEVK